MNRYPEISKKLILSKNIDKARNKVLSEIDSLRDDYKPKLSSSDFLIKYIYPNSLMLDRLQRRCFYNGIINDVISEDLLKFVQQHISDFTLFDLVFLRVHHPDTLSNSKERFDNVTSTPLHYDNYESEIYNYETRTTWIPLQDIDESTGSLCYSHNDNIIAMTGDGFSPNDFHDNQLNLNPLNRLKSNNIATKNSTKVEYIKLLKKNISTLILNAGSVVIFDKNLLHGGTYSKSKMRISLDVRWVDRRYPGSISQNLDVIKNKALSDLYFCNDFKFIYRETLNLKNITKHPRAILIALVRKFKPLQEIITFFKK